MRSTTTGFVVAALAASVSAHMNMYDPPPLKYKNNPNAERESTHDLPTPRRFSMRKRVNYFFYRSMWEMKPAV